jgi:hypothetical protein
VILTSGLSIPDKFGNEDISVETLRLSGCYYGCVQPVETRSNKLIDGILVLSVREEQRADMVNDLL